MLYAATHDVPYAAYISQGKLPVAACAGAAGAAAAAIAVTMAGAAIITSRRRHNGMNQRIRESPATAFSASGAYRTRTRQAAN
jgi:hypothetical protein